MIFQPGSGGSGGLGVVASGTSSATVDFDRPAVCVLASPRNEDKEGASAFCIPGYAAYVKFDGTNTARIILSEDGMRMSITGNTNKMSVQYLALG